LKRAIIEGIGDTVKEAGHGMLIKQRKQRSLRNQNKIRING
jgi:hypothetical protein